MKKRSNGNDFERGYLNSRFYEIVFHEFDGYRSLEDPCPECKGNALHFHIEMCRRNKITAKHERFIVFRSIFSGSIFKFVSLNQVHTHTKPIHIGKVHKLLIHENKKY